MKKLFAISAFSLFIWSCGHKMTPAATPDAPLNNSPMSNTSGENKGSTAATTSTANAAATVTTAARPTNATGTGTGASSSEAIAGQTIYNEKCNRCHGLKVVSDYTADRWVSIMQVMAPKARLTEVEKANVLVYVKANAKS